MFVSKLSGKQLILIRKLPITFASLWEAVQGSANQTAESIKGRALLAPKIVGKDCHQWLGGGGK